MAKPNFFWAFEMFGPGPIGANFRQLKAQAQITIHTHSRPKFKPNPILGPRNIQSPIQFGHPPYPKIQSETVEPVTCTCQAVFIFMDTIVELLTCTRRAVSIFMDTIVTFSQTQFIYYIRICLILFFHN